MAVKKKVETKPRPKPTPAKPKAKTKAKAKAKPARPMYVSVKVDMYHPFARVMIPTTAPGVELDRDSWLDSQIGAGLVKEL
jgi:hypothetical protein